MVTLVPDGQVRSRVEAELPRLPFAYFDERVNVPDWPEHKGAYLQLSALYAEEAATAEARGWPVDRMAANHLHMVVDPVGVAERILNLAQRVRTQR